MRRLHSFAGLAAALLVSFMAITGAILSIQPALETASAHVSGAASSVGALAGKVAAVLPEVERITRSASGTIVAYFTSGGTHAAAQIDPASGALLGPYEPSAFFSVITELHRSLFLGDTGHAVAGIASLAIAVLAVSGIFMLAARMGGWRRLFLPSRGARSQRLHTELARIAVAGLVVTAVTGAYMTALYFGFVPDGTSAGFAFAPSSSGGTPAAVGSLQALVTTPLSDLRELVFPAAGDTGDVFTLTTNAGQGYVDQATGAMLSFTPNNIWQQIYEAIYLLHTGQGLWWLGLVLGIAVLAVPAMAVTGTLIWWKRRRSLPRLPGNASWRTADTVLLVGSETNTTWSFAATLHAALTAGGRSVHAAPMNGLRIYPNARRLLVLTSTYGDGGAPASAHRFLARLADLAAAPAAEFAVLGFGDRSFANYCAYAAKVDAALSATGMSEIVPYAEIDRQSAQNFATWGRALGDALHVPLTLTHAPVRPRTQSLVLRDRTDFGMEVQAPTAILRFVAPADERGLFARMFRPRTLPRFAVGDLLGILPPGDAVPRYYSLASNAAEGVVEICVRKQTGGLCSEFLHGLVPGDSVDAFVRTNPDFRPAGGRTPLILIGAGSGVAPLAGIVRHNRRRRPVYLFFGARDPQSDFLYRDELDAAVADGRLTAMDTAFSRTTDGGYVQDRLLDNPELLKRIIAQGGQILVCGGLDMARGVRAALDTLLSSAGITAAMLKAQGRYLEDAY